MRLVPPSTPHIGAAPAIQSGCFSASVSVISPPSETPQAYVRSGLPTFWTKKSCSCSPAATPSATAHPLVLYADPASA